MATRRTGIVKSWQRRLILITSESKKEALEFDDDGVKILINDEILIVPIDEWEQYSTKFRILGGTRPSLGLLLILSPYDDFTYSEITESRNYFALEKMAATVTLCQLLGAKSVMTKIIKIYDKKTSQEYSIDLGMNKYSGELTSKKHELQSLKNKLQVNADFEGKVPNYDDAVSFLKENNLNTDLVLSQLVEMKKYEKDGLNKVNNITEEICLTESLQNTYDLVASINFPLGHVSTNYKKIVEEQIEILITLEIMF